MRFSHYSATQRIGEVVRARRTQAKLTQRDLAARSGLSIRALRYLENGMVTKPRSDTIRRLGVVLGVSEEDLNSLSVSDHANGTRLRLGVLGPLTVTYGGRSVAISGTKQRCLLGLLALQPNQLVSSEEIIDVLWGARAPASCRSLVHTYVARLRRTLAAVEPRYPRLIASASAGYLLRVRPAQLDLLLFKESVAQALSVRRHDPRSAFESFERAMRYWRAPVVADLPMGLREHPVAIATMAHRCDVVLATADTALELGRYEQAVALLRPVVLEEPLHEGLHVRLMDAFAGVGEQAAALGVFAGIRARLADALGVEPDAELHAAHLRVLRHQRPSRVQSAWTSSGSGAVGRAKVRLG